MKKDLDDIIVLPKGSLPEKVEQVGEPKKMSLSVREIENLINLSELEDMLHYDENFSGSLFKTRFKS